MGKSLKNRKDRHGVHLCAVCYFSNKKDKRIANRKFRRHTKQDAHISTVQENDCFKTFDINQVSNTYTFSSDGLAYYLKFSDGRYDDTPYTDEEIRKMKAK